MSSSRIAEESELGGGQRRGEAERSADFETRWTQTGGGMLDDNKVNHLKVIVPLKQLGIEAIRQLQVELHRSSFLPCHVILNRALIVSFECSQNRRRTRSSVLCENLRACQRRNFCIGLFQGRWVHISNVVRCPPFRSFSSFHFHATRRS